MCFIFISYICLFFSGILSGCDYLPSIPGIGLKKAHSLIATHRNGEKAVKRLRLEGQYKIPVGYEKSLQVATLTFIYQRVYDVNTQSLVHLTNMEGVDLLSIQSASNEFFGPNLLASVAQGIAEGTLHPDTHSPLEIKTAPPPELRRYVELLSSKPGSAKRNRGGDNKLIEKENVCPSKDFFLEAAPKKSKANSILNYFQRAIIPQVRSSNDSMDHEFAYPEEDVGIFLNNVESSEFYPLPNNSVDCKKKASASLLMNESSQDPDLATCSSFFPAPHLRSTSRHSNSLLFESPEVAGVSVQAPPETSQFPSLDSHVEEKFVAPKTISHSGRGSKFAFLSKFAYSKPGNKDDISSSGFSFADSELSRNPSSPELNGTLKFPNSHLHLRCSNKYNGDFKLDVVDSPIADDRCIELERALSNTSGSFSTGSSAKKAKFSPRSKSDSLLPKRPRVACLTDLESFRFDKSLELS